jgi:hypothetical protein
MIPDARKPTLRFILTTEFGDVTDITKDLNGTGIECLFWAIRDALAGCGYAKETIEEWFPVE